MGFGGNVLTLVTAGSVGEVVCGGNVLTLEVGVGVGGSVDGVGVPNALVEPAGRSGTCDPGSLPPESC